jgi:transcriptional regulator with XRE-family HTH domain
MNDVQLAKKRIELTIGQSLRTLRKVRQMNQAQVAAITGIPRSTISAIENGHAGLGVERMRLLARVLHCHPAVLVSAGWEFLLRRRA